jgi:methylenetetrahydrofolate reductase (NADPH)
MVFLFIFFGKELSPMSDNPMSDNPLRLSFEFFPPKNSEMETVLWETAQKLSTLNPEFVSVTYGAGGSTQEKTLDILGQFSTRYKAFPAAGHLTCVGKSKEDVNAVALAYAEKGIKRIVALRGDAPAGQATFTPHAQGYDGSVALVAGLRALGDFHISVAAYPEKHPESQSFEADIDHLKRKIDAGAHQAITQFFFDNDAYFRFLDKVMAAGITIPLIAGILPIMNFQTTKSFAEKCGTSLPASLEKAFLGMEKEPAARSIIAGSIAAAQCQVLMNQGVRDFHFYTLNRFELSLAIAHLLKST